MHYVTVVLNTKNEKPENLSREINGYLHQEGCKVQLIVSTIENDWCIPYIKKRFPKVKLAIMALRDHPGHCPRGSFMQLNNGLKLMKGDWFVFASGNDYVYPFKLKTEIECCIRNKKEVCYSAYDFTDENGNKTKYQPFHDYDFKKHFTGNFVSDCSIISKRLVNKHLPFRTELNNYAYWDLWLRVYEAESNVFHYNPIATWGYVQATTSMHVIRQKSPEQIMEAERDKNYMLSLHTREKKIGLKVLNICKNDWANFAWDNCKALRSVGIEADCLKTEPHKFNYPDQAPVLPVAEIAKRIANYDVIQFFFNIDLYHKLSMAIRQKKLIVYYASSDFRANKTEYLRFFNPIVHKSVIALGEFADKGAKNEVYLVGAVDTNKIKLSERKPQHPYIVAHYPSNPLIKGTETINNIAKSIKGIDYLSSSQRVNYKTQMERMMNCDIYIELFQPSINGQKYGSWGITALEAAAMGKIVVTQNLSHEVYKKAYGDCPLILCSTENELKDKLELLGSMTPDEIKYLQDKTREWVVKNHSYQATGTRILNTVLC